MTTKQRELKITIKDLLEAGVHFGHQTQRWNPKMKKYIFGERGGIHILDLAKTMHQIRTACDVVEKVIDKNQSILFVGTKKQAKIVIKKCAEDCGEFYVAERWLGGMLTNLTTLRQSVKKLERIEKKIVAGREGITKKELSLMNKEQDKLNRNLSGIRAMRKPPGLLIIIDPVKEHIAVLEARKLGIPVMSIVDTNCDPDMIDYVIAGNDDALKSNQIILQAITQAIIEKKEALGIPVGVVEEMMDEEEKSKEDHTKRFPKRREKDEVKVAGGKA